MSGGGGGSARASPEERRLLETQENIARSLFDQYEEVGSPILRSLGAEAQRADSPAELAAAAGRAGADVDVSFDQEQQRLTRSLGRHGLSPASGRYAGARRELALGRAASKAGAMTAGRRGARETAYRRRYNVLAAAQGNVGAAQHGLSSASVGYGNIANRRAQARAAEQGAWGSAVGGAVGLAAAFL